jgi:hypothetical protein
MRWENLSDRPAGDAARDAALFGTDAVTTRVFDTPEFRGITFHEIRARSRSRARAAHHFPESPGPGPAPEPATAEPVPLTLL